jgi:hypothetical protein
MPTGLPDGFFPNKKISILVYYGRPWYGKFCHASQQFGVFCSYLSCGMTNAYILLLFGVFSPFWCIVPRKIWQPWMPNEHHLSSSSTESLFAVPSQSLDVEQSCT